MLTRRQTRARVAKTATVATTTSSPLSARDRLVAAADALFYQEGVHVVGIDRIVERAGVAKASLYSIFGSKDELVRAYLEEHFRDRQRRVARILDATDNQRDRILGVFAEMDAALAAREFRGCRFILASAEAHPGDASDTVADEYRAWLRSVFSDQAEAAGARDPKSIGRQLTLLYDGAAVAARMDRERTEGAST